MRVLSALLLFALLAGCGSNAAYRAPTDAAFQDMVLEVMPGYVLTEEVLGRPVVRSPGYALELNPSATPWEEVFEGFIVRHEETGLSDVLIDFRGRVEGEDAAQYFRADFPGCAPGECVAAIADTRFQRISAEEYRHFYPGARETKWTNQVILSAPIDGVDYLARLSTVSDISGRVIKYRFRSNRSAITPREIGWARTTELGVPAGTPVATYSYVNNMALGVDAEGPAMNVFAEINLRRGL